MSNLHLTGGNRAKFWGGKKKKKKKKKKYLSLERKIEKKKIL